MTALTVIVAQNPENSWAHDIYPIELAVIDKQIDTICQGIGVDAMKTGMLGSAALVEMIAAKIKKYQLKNVVIDPVMVCKGIDAIMVPEAAAGNERTAGAAGGCDDAKYVGSGIPCRHEMRRDA